LQAINAHASALRGWTYDQLSKLQHSNGQPLLRIFGAHDRGAHVQSALFQFLVLRANGSALAAPQVQKDASDAGLHLRAGCHCNPGQCLFDLGILPEEVRGGGCFDAVPFRGGRRLLLPWRSVNARSNSSHSLQHPQHATTLPLLPPFTQERQRAIAGDLDKPYITVMRPNGAEDGKLQPVQLPTGSVRASLGSLSTFEDVYALTAFLTATYLE